MKKPSAASILSSIKSIDVSVQQLHAHVGAARAAFSAAAHCGPGARKRQADATKAMKPIEALPVTLVAGKKVTLGFIVEGLRKTVSPQTLATLTPETFWRTAPFAQLGGLAIGPRSGGFATTFLRDFFPAFGGSAEQRRALSPAPHSHTLWMYYSHSWWTTLLYSHYEATTKATATGWDACDILGGEYEAAKQACQTLVVPPPSDPSAFIIAFLKAAACNYANKAPEVSFPALRIQTYACSCLAKGADGTCSPLHPDGRLDSSCSEAHGANTGGPITATYTQWLGPTCLGVTSRHIVEFTRNVFLVEDFC